jgi:hypothetical protein
MKIIIIALISLLVGVGVGWYFGYTRPTAKTDRYVRQQMQEIEDDNAIAAIFAVNTIPLIESGQTQNAVRMLSFPIARYYSIYTTKFYTNDVRLKLRAKIEQLASTNQIVAAQIKEELGYGETLGKIQ